LIEAIIVMPAALKKPPARKSPATETALPHFIVPLTDATLPTVKSEVTDTVQPPKNGPAHDTAEETSTFPKAEVPLPRSANPVIDTPELRIDYLCTDNCLTVPHAAVSVTDSDLLTKKFP
jgi:hypothetical protein